MKLFEIKKFGSVRTVVYLFGKLLVTARAIKARAIMPRMTS